MRWWWLFALCACRWHFDPIDGDALGPTEIEVVVEGQGLALVEGNPPCVSRCRYATGPLELTAFAGEAWELDRFSTCGAQPTCTAELGTQVTVTFRRSPVTANVMFVSSQNAPLTGLADLDTFCMQRAAAGGLPGTFVAFVSTSMIDAVARLGTARGFVRVDGLPVFNTAFEIPNLATARGVTLDENGAGVARITMTGSGPGATRYPDTCTDWTSQLGPVNAGFSSWTSSYMFGNNTAQCAAGLPIYCVQNDRDATVSLTPPPLPAGRLLFVTSQPFTPVGGIASADAQCASEAAAASLTGTFRALLATAAQSAADHVSGVGGLWRRPDGIALAWNGLDQGVLDAGIYLDAMGLGQLVFAYVGAPNLHALGVSTCADWTEPAAPNANVSYSFDTMPFVNAQTVGACLEARLFCAELP